MIRILIASPVRLLADLIQATCRQHTELTVVATVPDANLVKARELNYDVLIADVNLPHAGALELVRQMRKPNHPAVVVVGLPEQPELIVRYLEAGASGCVTEQDSSEMLVRVLHAAAARQVALNQHILHAVVERVHRLAHECRLPPTKGEADKGLTRREREVLRLVADGYNNRQIAEHLTIELGTTKNHIHNILDKLQVKTRRDAALLHSLGLVA